MAKRVEARRKARSGKAKDVRVNPSDPEAVYHKLKNDRFAFGYVPSITVNRQRIIVAQTVHRSGEIAVVEEMLDRAERLIGPPRRMCLDAGYFGFEVLELANKRALDLLCPAPEQVPDAKQPKKFAKHQFEYVEELGTYVCPAGEEMIAASKGFNPREDQHYQYFRTPACNQGCELRDKCIESKRGRRLKRWELDELQETMRRIMRQPRAIRAYCLRKGSVEPVFGELKRQQGLNRFRCAGLGGVKVEFSLHAIAHNLMRLKVALTEAPSALSALQPTSTQTIGSGSAPSEPPDRAPMLIALSCSQSWKHWHRKNLLRQPLPIRIRPQSKEVAPPLAIVCAGGQEYAQADNAITRHGSLS